MKRGRWADERYEGVTISLDWRPPPLQLHPCLSRRKTVNSAGSESGHSAHAVAPRDLKARMDAVERLTKLFKLERMVHLGVTSISLAVLLVSAGLLLVKGTAGPAELTGLFGSSGLISYSAGRLLVMWNQALRLLAGEATGGQS